MDAWDARGAKDKLIYGNKMKALPVQEIRLKVGDFLKNKPVNASDKEVIFDIPLRPGNMQVKGTFIDQGGGKADKKAAAEKEGKTAKGKSKKVASKPSKRSKLSARSARNSINQTMKDINNRAKVRNTDSESDRCERPGE